MVNLSEIAAVVLACGAQDGVLLTDDRTHVEAAVLPAVRRIGAQAVEVYLSRQKLGYVGPRRPCACGRAQRFVEHRPKQIATQMGSLTIR